MATTWRMHVWAPDGTARATLGLTGSIASLDSFSVDAAGDCLEATWQAVPADVNIVVRDSIALEVSTNDGASYTRVYKGLVVAAGNPRATVLQQYRAIGLRQRLYEVLLEEPVITGGDVATMVQAAMSSIALPNGVTYAAGDVPTLSFQLGDRYPAFETVGAFLDALAETVGRFIVPTGQSYTYDGTTYNAGDMVPAVRWGVRADGSFFFGRPQATAISVGETDPATIVRWDRVAGEEVYDRVALVYASEYEDVETYRLLGGNEEPIPHPLVRTYGSGPYEATRRHVLTAPLDYMENVAGLWSDNNATNPSNAFDGDDLTYAEFGGAGTGVAFVEGISLGRDGAIARVVFEKGASTEPLDIQLQYDAGANLPTWVYRYDDTDTNKRIAILPLPPPANFDISGNDTILVSVRSGDAASARVYSIEIFVPDETLGAKVAEGYEQEPEGDVSRVVLQGQLGAVTQTMNLTPRGEAAIEVRIERTEYRVTKDRGLSTTYHVGQEYDAEQLAEKIVLERLVRKAKA